MSYLEMAASQLPDMQKGIISLWFRDPLKQAEAPPPKVWPSTTGVWTQGTDTMVPPDVYAYVGANPNDVAFWNPYGRFISAAIGGGGITLPVFNGAPVFWGVPPPFATDNIHMVLSFGDPDQHYDYYSWQLDKPSVIPFVQYTGDPTGLGVPWYPSQFPPPYAPYFVNVGGDKGLFTVINFKLSAGPILKPNFTPQSFIGIDKDGYLIICLQTNTRPPTVKYKGWAWQIDKITNLMACVSYLIFPGPPYTYNEIGFPFPDGYWVQECGYWNGYEFAYKDISNEVMGAQGETFIIGGGPVGLDFSTMPAVRDGAWHHLLFSFDISGPVHCEYPPAVPGVGGGLPPPPVVTTACKAWLALDDVNYAGNTLQHKFPMHDALSLPLLPGMGTDVTGFGPVTSELRQAFHGLGDNDILPKNVWIHGVGGLPTDSLIANDSASGIMSFSNAWQNKGDYNRLRWAGVLWPLYGDGVAPGPWLPVLTPLTPTTPNPKDNPDQFPPPTYDCPSFTLPVNGFPIGIPASTHHIDHNTGVEMAELQIWANQTLDVSDENNRRLFIDANGKPVPPKVAERALGKPDVLLHGSGNWKKGRNTGTTGVAPDGTRKPDGQFSPNARILAYKPEPQLNK